MKALCIRNWVATNSLELSQTVKMSKVKHFRICVNEAVHRDYVVIETDNNPPNLQLIHNH